jgi:glycosyltransferase involved in cell wall biosynthesis
MEIIHIIGSLGSGGAENQLARIAINQVNRNCGVTIILFDSTGTSLEHKCTTNGVKIINIGIRKGSILKGVSNLFSELNNFQEKNIIYQSWMYAADLFLGIWGLVNMLRMRKRANIFWNVRCTKFTGFSNFSLKRYIVAMSCIPLSYLVPRKIINCAYAAKNEHEKWMYDKSKMVVIHNCFNEAEFLINEKISSPDVPFIIGFVGRNDPIKNFPVFIDIITSLINRGLDIKVNVAGRGYNPQKELPSKLKQYFDFKGEINDMASFYNDIDLLVVTSLSEGFPNIIVEAGLAGVDCISFDVGDACYILPEENIIKNYSTNNMLLNIEKHIKLKPDTKKSKIRERNLGRFDIDSSVDSYEKIYLEAINAN